jgi:pilus assembly protein Flp/PilA
MLRLWTAFQSRIIRDEEGAGMVEYALLVALIGVLLVGALVLLRGGIDAVFTGAATELETAT